MAPAGTLWTIPYQPKGKIIKAVAAIGGIEIELPAAYEHYVDNKKPEFLEKFPHGKIPAWDGANGFKLFEGLPIARYLATLAPSSGLLGGSPKDAALVDQWTHLAEYEFDHYTDLIQGMCSGRHPYTKAAHTTFLERQQRTINTLEAHISTRTFFVGERLTLADLTIAIFVQKAVATTVDAPIRAKIPNLIRHLETVVNQPKVKDIYGPITYTEKGIQYTPPPKEKKDPKPAAEKKAD